ncbi:MAG: hypothetical protein V7K69_30835 [Nostoc sp.]
MRYAVANTSYVYFQKSNRIPIILFAIAEMALFVAIAWLEKSRTIAPIN